MEHEVYICYDDADKTTADAICHVLEENKIKCWIKPRDLGVGHIVEECTDSIRNSKAFVLIFSENSKNSNFVNTEVDMAFENNIPILVFSIDNSKLDGGLEFFLQGKHWLDAYPNPEIEFRTLIMDTSKVLGKPIIDPIVTTEKKDEEKKITPKQNDTSVIKKYKKFIIPSIIIIVILIIALFSMPNSDMNLGNSPVESIDISDISVENHTGEESTFNYTYKIKGIIKYDTNKAEGFNVTSELYDSKGTIQDSYSNPLNILPNGEVCNLGGGITANNNITKVVVKVVDSKNQTVKQAEHSVN